MNHYVVEAHASCVLEQHPNEITAHSRVSRQRFDVNTLEHPSSAFEPAGTRHAVDDAQPCAADWTTRTSCDVAEMRISMLNEPLTTARFELLEVHAGLAGLLASPPKAKRNEVTEVVVARSLHRHLARHDMRLRRADGMNGELCCVVSAVVSVPDLELSSNWVSIAVSRPSPP